MGRKLILSIVLCFPFVVFSAELNPNKADTSVKVNEYSQFTSKGKWMGGGTLSLEFRNTSDKDQLIRYVDESKDYDFSIRADGARAFTDKNFAGMAFLYGQSKKSGFFVNSDGQAYTEDFFGTRYSFTPFLKNLTPVDKDGRFNIITQIEFLNQIDQSITQTIVDEDLTRKRSMKYTGLLGIRPGISIFMLGNVAFETTLNVAGVKYSYEKVTSTDMPDTVTENASINFRIDILQLNIGVFVYF